MGPFLPWHLITFLVPLPTSDTFPPGSFVPLLFFYRDLTNKFTVEELFLANLVHSICQCGMEETFIVGFMNASFMAMII